MKVKIFLLVFIISFSVYSQNYYYDDISSIEYQYLEQGLGLPFKSFPYSEDEVYSYLDKIDSGGLSDTGRLFNAASYDALKKEYIYSEPDGFEFDVGIEVALEGYYHKNIDNNFDFSSREYTWQHGYEERLPMLNIPLEAKILDLLYVKTGIIAKEEHMTVNCTTEDTAAENYSSIIDFASPKVDIHFPFQALASLGAEHWNVQLGRDKLSWGNGQTGNLILSDYSDFYDYLLVKTWWNNFKFSTVYVVMDPFSPRDEEGDTDIDGNDIPDGKLDNLEYQAFIAHRFDVRFFKRLNFAFVEAVAYTGDPFYIRDLNSLMPYHNWTIPEKTNSIMSLELEYIPWKYFYLYGQLVMDEFATKYEEEGDGGGGQSTWAWLGGIKGAYPLGEGYIHGNVEYVHTDPLLYHRRKAPYLYNVRRIWSLVSDQYEYIVKPIGHEAGPDAKLWHFELGYDWTNRLKSNLGFDYLVQGTTTINDPYEKTNELITPVGIVESVSVLHLELEAMIFEYLSAGLDFYYIQISNYGHIENQNTSDMEITSYIKLTL